MINIITIIDEFYWKNRMGPWVDAMRKYSNHHKISVVTQGFELSSEDKSKYNFIEFRYLDPFLLKVNNTNHCVQEGGWLTCFPEASDSDIFVVIDGDAIPQRELDFDEITFLEELKEYELAMNWNACINDLLIDEAARIFPKVSLTEIYKEWQLTPEHVCYNAGVIAAKISCWKSFYAQYCTYWEKTEDYFNHIARQQWLINWLSQAKPFSVKRLPLSFHTHGHYGLFPGVHIKENKVFYNHKLVLFSHKINWNPYGA